MIEHCDKIQKALNRFGDDFETFKNDDVLRDAVSMNLQQIGELAKKFSEEFMTVTRPEMNWRAITGMRNLFAHDTERWILNAFGKPQSMIFRNCQSIANPNSNQAFLTDR